MIVPFSLAGLGLSIYFFRKASGGLSLKRLNIVTILFYVIIIFQYIGSFLLVSGIFDYRFLLINKISNPEAAILKAHIVLLGVLILLPLSILFFSKILRINLQTELRSLYNRKIVFINNTGDGKILPFLVLAAVIVTLGFIYMSFSAKTIPILEVFRGEDTLAIKQARISALEGNFVLKLLNGIVGNWLAPVLTLVVFGYYKLKKTSGYFFLFVLLFIVTASIVLFSTAKAPIVRFLLCIVVLNSIFVGKLPIKKLVFLGIGLTFLMLIQYIFFMGETEFQIAFLRMGSRIFFAQHLASVLTLDYFPNYEGFLGGKLFVPFSSFIFGGEEVRSFALRLMEYYLPSEWEKGTVGYMSTLFVSEGYANWGWLGVPLAIIIVGFFISMILYMTLRLRLHPVTLALAVFLMINVPFALNSGLRIAIYSPELIITCFTLAIVVFISRGKASIKIKRKSFSKLSA